MNTKMSQITRQEVLVAKRDRYARAGKEHKTKIIDELVELFGYHRKAAIRALQSGPVIAAPFVLGRPKEYDPDQLRPPLKAIWLAALQPCGVRLKGVPARLAGRLRGGSSPPQRRCAPSVAPSQPRHAGPAADPGTD
jgi:hypothetical protein